MSDQLDLVWRSETAHVRSRHDDRQNLRHWNQPIESYKWNIAHATHCRQVKKHIDGGYDRTKHEPWAWKIPETIEDIIPTSNGKARNSSSTTWTRSPKKKSFGNRPKWFCLSIALEMAWVWKHQGLGYYLVEPNLTKRFPIGTSLYSDDVRNSLTEDVFDPFFKFDDDGLQLSCFCNWRFTGLNEAYEKAFGSSRRPCTSTRVRGKVRSREIKWQIWREQSRTRRKR